MIFVDEARILVQGGNGGQGCVSFYRDKYMRYPKTDGGDGGCGGNVVITADKSVRTLLDFKYKQHYTAHKGGNASSNRKTGKTGEDCILKVPEGTLIKDDETELLIRDLTTHGQSVIVAKGGKGGLGNAKNNTPTLPEKGEELTIRLELKLMADVGLIGFPNAGKSTIITSISKAKSKIANYPFTTKEPVLGIVKSGDFDFIIADLPGIIEGAHEGRGLGDRFLKHAERTKLLVHVIDMAGVDGRKPYDDYVNLNHELKEYSEEFSAKGRIIVANKMDLPEAADNLKKFKKKYKGKILEVSAAQRKGLDKLINQIKEELCRENSHKE